ncbi:DNA kinase/phosphatase Pnk1 [Leucoagaricus gongylophorus]
MQAGSSKRPAEEHPSGEPTPKKSDSQCSLAGDMTGKPTGSLGPFQWLAPLGKNKTCLHGKNLTPKYCSKVAAFDLDGTIIKFTKQTCFNNGWEWWNAAVPAKLQSVAEEGHAIVILSNQAIKSGALEQWKEKVSSMGSKLKDVPFWMFAATARDEYRKPMLGMWWELEKIFNAQGVKIDLEASFFVGDAAGRQYKNRRPDFSSTDRKLALNIGISFKTPEEYFLNLSPNMKYTLPGFHVSSLPDFPVTASTSSPIVSRSGEKEIVLFCGYPALGKSSFYYRHFHPANYTHINQDKLKTREKCIKAVRDALKRDESCVVGTVILRSASMDLNLDEIDNTNRDIKTRKFYIDLAREEKVPIRQAKE